jgi:hypothetical protein
MNEDFYDIFEPWMSAEECDKVVTLLESEIQYEGE